MVGSVADKAEYKKDYINVIVGVVLITMVTNIISIIFDLASGIDLASVII